MKSSERLRRFKRRCKIKYGVCPKNRDSLPTELLVAISSAWSNNFCWRGEENWDYMAEQKASEIVKKYPYAAKIQYFIAQCIRNF